MVAVHKTHTRFVWPNHLGSCNRATTNEMVDAMPVLADDPLLKVTLNLYEADVHYLRATYGEGWSTRLRQMVHHEVIKRQIEAPRPRTVGDLK